MPPEPPVLRKAYKQGIPGYTLQQYILRQYLRMLRYPESRHRIPSRSKLIDLGQIVLLSWATGLKKTPRLREA